MKSFLEGRRRESFFNSPATPAEPQPTVQPNEPENRPVSVFDDDDEGSFVARVEPPAARSAPAVDRAHPVGADTAASHQPEIADSCDDGTTVETITVDGRVTRIIVTCACGQRTEIACRY